MENNLNESPPLPPLQGEILLEVYTHKSLGKLVGLKDNERYVVLGATAFQLAVTHCVFKQYPNYSSKEIEEEVGKLISDDNFVRWAAQYKLREKLRYNPADKDEIFTSYGAREIFLAYMGGVYDQPKGHGLLVSWVMSTFFPSMAKSPEQFPTNDTENNHQNNHHYRSGNASPPLLPTHKPRPSFPDTPHFPEPRSGYSTPLTRDVPPHMAHGLSQRPIVAYLPRFNEITTRRRLDVQWVAEQQGMQHAPLWSVNCFVNGHVYGTGIGSTKQLAKEEAAKEAYTTLRLDA